MYRLLCLGQLSLLGEDGRPVVSAAAQPRRLALLAALGRTAPRAVSRDKLIGWLWPDADEDRARRALNQALYALRTELGSEDVVQGQRELFLNLDLIGCDVAEFDAAVESGRLEDAAALYRGPFLDGFHAGASPEFEQWIDEERRALGHRQAANLETLARTATAKGQPADAVAWWRKAAAADPTNVRLATTLMRSLAASGDRTGAVRYAAIFEAMVRQQLDVPADPAVAALAEELSRLPDPAPVSQPAVAAAPRIPEPIPESTPAPAAAVIPAAVATPPAPRRRRIVVGAVAVAVVTVATVVMVRGNGPTRSGPTARPGPQAVAVVPLANQTGDPSLDLVGSMVTDWVTQGLSQTGLVTVVDARTLVAAGDTGQEAGRAAGADLVVTGSVIQEGDSLKFLTRIVNAKTGRIEAPIPAVTAHKDRPTAALTTLGQRVTGALAVLLDDRLGNAAASASQPPTWAAYQEFLLGMRDFGKNYDSNFVHFSRASRLDSTYWQARLWAGIALANARHYPAADSVFVMVSDRQDLLAPYDRASLDYFSGGFIHGDWERSYRGARTMTELAPLAGHAMWALGLTARITNRLTEAAKSFGRVDLESRWGREWGTRIFGELTRVGHLQGNHEAELAAARQMIERSPGDGGARTREVVALSALARYRELADRVESAAGMPEDRRAWSGAYIPGAMLLEVALELRAHANADTARRYLDAAVAWYAATTEAGATDTAHLHGHADALYAAGRWADAGAVFARLVAIDSVTVDYRAGLGMVAAHLGDTAAARATVARLLAWPTRYAFGKPAQQAAQIETALGRKEEAVRLLTRSIKEGRARWYFWHADPDLTALRGFRPFEELLTPRN